MPPGGHQQLWHRENKQLPKVGHVGGSKRFLTEDDQTDEVMKNGADKAPPGI